MTKDNFKEYIRKSVLNSLDNSMLNITGEEDKGWTDDDLSNIFPGIDKHIDNLYDRHYLSITNFLEK